MKSEFLVKVELAVLVSASSADAAWKAARDAIWPIDLPHYTEYRIAGVEGEQSPEHLTAIAKVREGLVAKGVSVPEVPDDSEGR
jgi:hypothetical protein